MILLIIGLLLGMLICKKPETIKPPEEPKVKVVRFNIPTQPIGQYLQIGNLYSNGRVLPLYGRRAYNGSQLWNYYTLSDGNHPVRMSFFNEKRDCSSEYGCKELYNNDKVFLVQYDTEFTIELYDNSIHYVP